MPDPEYKKMSRWEFVKFVAADIMSVLSIPVKILTIFAFFGALSVKTYKKFKDPFNLENYMPNQDSDPGPGN